MKTNDVKTETFIDLFRQHHRTHNLFREKRVKIEQARYLALFSEMIVSQLEDSVNTHHTIFEAKIPYIKDRDLIKEQALQNAFHDAMELFKADGFYVGESIADKTGYVLKLQMVTPEEDKKIKTMITKILDEEMASIVKKNNKANKQKK